MLSTNSMIKYQCQITMAISTSGTPITILFNNEKRIFDKDQSCELTLELEHTTVNPILFSIKGMVPGGRQRISVTNILVNGASLMDWRKFCLFNRKNNLYIENISVEDEPELSFNGDFLLNISKNLNQFEWFSFYFSKRREDFVYNNTQHDCHADYGCYEACICPKTTTHILSWQNKPHCEYEINRSYRYACFGCSITYGSAIPLSGTWPSQLSQKQNCRVLNFGVPRIGVDGILYNLISAVKKFKIEEIILLLPNLERRLARIKRGDFYFRIPITGNALPEDSSIYTGNIYMNSNWLNEKLLKKHKSIIKDNNNRFGRKACDLLLKQLGQLNIPFRLSSWSNETYEYISQRVKPNQLLPLFENDRNALDRVHPSINCHDRFVRQILK